MDFLLHFRSRSEDIRTTLLVPLRVKGAPDARISEASTFNLNLLPALCQESNFFG
jgi:hypothetical protein